MVGCYFSFAHILHPFGILCAINIVFQVLIKIITFVSLLFSDSLSLGHYTASYCLHQELGRERTCGSINSATCWHFYVKRFPIKKVWDYLWISFIFCILGLSFLWKPYYVITVNSNAPNFYNTRHHIFQTNGQNTFGWWV